MDLGTPARAIIPTLEAEVLTVLANVNTPLTGREVSRHLEAKSHRGVGLVLERLRTQGVVDVTEAGNAYLFTLNRDHITFPAIQANTVGTGPGLRVLQNATSLGSGVDVILQNTTGTAFCSCRE